MKSRFKIFHAAILVLAVAATGGMLPKMLLARGRPKSHKPPPQLTEVSLSGTVEKVEPKALIIKVTSSKPPKKKSKSKSSGSVASDQDGTTYSEGQYHEGQYHEGQYPDSQYPDSQFIECTYTKGKKKTPKDSGVWTVYGKLKTSVLIEGTATIDYLRPGQTIEFSGMLSGDTVTNNLDKINIVPKHGHNLNIGGGPGVATKDDLKPTSIDAGSTSITARIQSINGTAVVAWVGERTLHLTLSNLPSVHVESDDPKLIVAGAKITVTGQGYHGPNLCQADTIKVTLVAPLTAKKLPASEYTLPSTDAEKADLPKIVEDLPSTDEASSGSSDADKPKDDDAAKAKPDDAAK